jgi:hypothetical protein
MITIARPIRSALTVSALRCAGAALALVVLMASSQASLVCPGLPEFKLEEATSSCAPADSAPSTPADEQQAEHIQVHAFGTTSGSTSGTSSSPSFGSGSTSSVALRSADASSLADLALTGWVASELRFSLPLPLGNDLLRPPQGV